MNTLRGWLVSTLLGATIVSCSPPTTTTKDSKKPDPSKAVSELIKSREFAEALKVIKELEASQPKSKVLRTLKTQWFVSLMAGAPPEGFDAASEAQVILGAARKAATEDPDRILDLVWTTNLAVPVIAKFGSADAAIEEAKTTVALFDNPTFFKQEWTAYITMQLGYAATLQQVGKNEEAAKVMTETIDRLEKLSKELPDNDVLRSTLILTMGVGLKYLSEAEREAMRSKAVGLSETLLMERPSSSSITTYVSLHSLLLGSIPRDNPEVSRGLIEKAIKSLEEVASSHKALEKSASNGVASLKQFERPIEAALKRKEMIGEMIGKAAPAFDAIKWINGKPISQEELKGKVVLLNFWAAFWEPCINTFPELRRWHGEYSGKGLVIIGVSQQSGYIWDEETKKVKVASDPSSVTLEDELAVLDKFVNSHELRYRTMVTLKESKMPSNYGVSSFFDMPCAAVIDQDGKVQLLQFGSKDQSTARIEAKIKELLGL